MGMKQEILQQHKNLMLIWEKNIFVYDMQSTLYVPQTTWTRNVVIGN